MKTFSREDADNLFQKHWDELQNEWFKIEVLQDYSGEDSGPSLQSWLAGDKEKSVALMRNEVDTKWIKSCQEKLKQGVNLLRFHIVSQPYTPYVEWEIEYYKHINIPRCGEKIFLINSATIGDIQLPTGDVMIFDDKRVTKNTYDSDGRMTNQTFYDESDNISGFLELKSALMKLGAPLE